MATRPITDPFVLHACELLSCLGPVKAIRMFGGYGLSVDGMNVAIIAWETLFLKANAETEPQWLAAGGRPFQYEAQGKTLSLHYFTPPDEALELAGVALARVLRGVVGYSEFLVAGRGRVLSPLESMRS
jgi:DNA transformation protein and related proteins